jgi:hypothetical protein
MAAAAAAAAAVGQLFQLRLQISSLADSGSRVLCVLPYCNPAGGQKRTVSEIESSCVTVQGAPALGIGQLYQLAFKHAAALT